MRKIFILFILLASCEKHNASKEENNVTIDSTFSNNIERMDSLLVKTEGLEDNIKKVVHQKDIFKKENYSLKEEIAITKDCLVVANKKINKIPKKRSFFDKVLGVKKDSTTDTIK
jgi:hypothetical protein